MIEKITCTEEELSIRERNLATYEYRLVVKDEKDLCPKEYIKLPSASGPDYFGGPRMWLLTIRHD